MSAALPIIDTPDAARILDERQIQRVVRAFIASGLIFMLLPGSFLGAWNLLTISQNHRIQSIPQPWIQAHGHAQIFGWIGSFILGIGYHGLTRMKSTKAFPVRAAWTAWALWTVGVLLRWIGGITPHHWRTLLSFAVLLQFDGFLMFYRSVRRHALAAVTDPSHAWKRLVAWGSLAFLLTLAVNGWMLLRQALYATSPAIPHWQDQQLVVLAVWGVLVPTIWGLNARWLPLFLGLRPSNQKVLYAAYAFSVAGVLATFLSLLPVAEVTFFIATLLAIEGLHVWERAASPPQLTNSHRSFSVFVRVAYGWLLISCLLAIMAVRLDTAGGIWGASRPALTVGFVSIMVFAIGQRILPAVCGMRVLWSYRLMGWSLCVLLVGCFLRVLAEPLAYEGIWIPAWKVLPFSAAIELVGVSLFAINIVVTIFRAPASSAVAAN